MWNASFFILLKCYKKANYPYSKLSKSDAAALDYSYICTTIYLIYK